MREQFSDDEWAALIGAPAAVIAAIIGSSPGGPIAIMQEVGAAVRVFEQAATERRDNPLIAAVLVALKARFEAYMGKSNSDPAVEQVDVIALGADPAKAVAMVRTATDLLGGRIPEAQAHEYRTWLLELAQQVAEAAPEGGFLGMGGTPVNEEEQAMLDELRDALGLA